MKRMLTVGASLAIGMSAMIFSGCVSGDISSPATRVELDDESMDGGISSADIRTVATQMCPALLTLPEIAEGVPPVRIKMASMKNTSRFFIDSDLFMKRLRVELNRYGKGQVRFTGNNSNANASRVETLEELQEEKLRQDIQALAKSIAANPLFANASTPVKITVIPILNANLVNMNADSFAAMLRGEVANASGGKIQFLMPGEVKGADYWLTGQFYPETMKSAGIINLADYIKVIDERIKDGKSLYIDDVKQSIVATPPTVTVTATSTRETILLEMLRNPAMHVEPNVNKYLNMMIVRPTDKVSVFEKTLLADRRITDNASTAKYILSGEISGLTQSSGAATSDYLLITMQLVDIATNDILWEEAYEVKRLTRTGVVYR